MQILQILVTFFFITSSVFATYNETHFKGNRTVIVHLFEWKFSDIARECEDFLSGAGFGGVQVSPVNEHIIINSPNRPWWERYQPVSYQIGTRSGNMRDFMNMVGRCNRAGIRIYVDVVFNHMTGNNSENIGTAGSLADYENFEYTGVPYEKIDFNEPCVITDSSDPVIVRNCQLYGLRDLNQKLSYVSLKIVNFLNNLIEIGVAGFRIDAASYMWPEDLESIYERLNNLNTEHGFNINSRPFIYHEIADLGADDINRNEYTPLGPITEYRAGIKLGMIFRGFLGFDNFRNWNSGLVPSKDAVIFVDNFHNQRGQGAGSDLVLTHKHSSLYRAAVTFLMAHSHGNMRLMSSYAFTDPDAGPPTDIDGNILSPYEGDISKCRDGWICEHKWGPIYRMVKFRSRVSGSTDEVRYATDEYLFLERSGKGAYFLLSKIKALNLTVDTGLPPGIYCDIISGERIINFCTGKSVIIDNNGRGDFKFTNSDTEYVMAIHIGVESMLS